MSLKAKIKNTLVGSIIIYVDFLLNLILRCREITLLLRKAELKNLENIVFGLDQGYGHTITAPAIYCDLYDSDCLFIFFNQTGRLNTEHANLFVEPKIKFFRKNLRFSNDQTVVWLARILVKYARLQGFEGNFHYCADRQFDKQKIKMPYLYETYLNKYELKKIGERVSTEDWCEFFVKTYDFKNHKIKFSKEYISQFNAAIRSEKGDRKIVCLYRREKTKGGISSERRVGGDLDNYARVLSYLKERGFIILVVGETSEIKQRFPFLIRAEDISVKKEVFDICAIMASQYFIGNAGGGSWLPLFSKAEIIYVDAYPLWFMPRDATTIPKRVERHGKKVSASNSVPASFWESDDLVVKDSDPNLLYEAIKSLTSDNIECDLNS